MLRSPAVVVDTDPVQLGQRPPGRDGLVGQVGVGDVGCAELVGDDGFDDRDTTYMGPDPQPVATEADHR